jgi:hypothetical protein
MKLKKYIKLAALLGVVSIAWFSSGCTKKCSHPDGHMWGKWQDNINSNGNVSKNELGWHIQSRTCETCGLHDGGIN